MKLAHYSSSRCIMHSLSRSIFSSRRKVRSYLLHRWHSSTLGVTKRFVSDVPLEWSYVCGPGTRPLLGLTIGQAVDRADGMFGDREAIVSVPQALSRTFMQVKKECDQLAAGFLASGLEPGDRLGIWGPSSYEWYVTQFAAAKAGLVLVNINPGYRPNELEYCLNKVAVKGIVCHEKFKTSDYYKLLCDVAPELPTSTPGDLRSVKLPHLKKVFMCSQKSLGGTWKFDDLYEAGDSSHLKMVDELTYKIQFDSPNNIQFTSGTTGNPKAAVLSHHMLVNNAYSVGGRVEYGKRPHRIGLSVPLYHCFGCVAGTICGMLYGGTCVLPCFGFDPDAIVKAIESEKISSLYGTPTMFVDILNAYDKNPVDLSSLSTGIMSGASCPQELVTAVRNVLQMKDFMVMYGMTETSPVTFQCFPTDPPEVRSSTIGYPGDHIEVKVVNESGDIVRVGESGELLIRGYCTFLGYWGDPEKTRETVTEDRWLKTGDLALIQPDGYGKIVGRKKDMIIRGGENIYPAEIENFLMGHPDVFEAQVFGVPDTRMGEEVATWIRKTEGTSLTAEDLKEWCKGKIAHYKVPRYILFKDEFPRTVTGKIQKFRMREDTVKELSLKT